MGAAATRLVCFAQERAGGGDAKDYLDTVVIDSEGGDYPDGVGAEALRRLGVRVLDLPLVTERSAPHYDAGRIASLLVRLASARPT